MPENPYEPSSANPPWEAGRGFRVNHFYFSIAGSLLLLLLGTSAAALAGTFRGTLLVAAPLLIGIPAVLNTHAATYLIKSKESKLTSQYPGPAGEDE